ncbi:phosphatase PAP2 family protein [Streptomyces sp. ACA25]|uniref:phosphatase PAP2 family protein n=1 Tax=Streptomyces sp. ACA25 TaxID=3022596 RepID=UPI0023079507|nr:phosphatase PAP2 family protein [Streptomyces sp. ACA25]MDB1087920.1 phosphatase PAP2 family protein [Streptomyces sp. ACA25]
MAGLENPDVDVLRGINGLAEGLTGWVGGAVTFMGEFGLPLALVLLVFVTWWVVRRRTDAVQAVAGAAWAPLAAALAYLLNSPIREFVGRPRPFVVDADIHVMLDGKVSYSFVSDHASGAMTIAVALILVHRRIGLIALALALLQGFARVLMGLHYPTDIIGGFALGTALALLLSPLAMAALTPLVRICSESRWLGWVAVPAAGPDAGPRSGPDAGPDAEQEQPPTGRAARRRARTRKRMAA